MGKFTFYAEQVPKIIYDIASSSIRQTDVVALVWSFFYPPFNRDRNVLLAFQDSEYLLHYRIGGRG